ncbi:MAG: triose-phosphate isomerase [Parcubacteria group bacterium]|nr:triose-phosphate isomerase [Parcubacteria group bacterium]
MYYIVANWKMQLDFKESLGLTKKILKGLKKLKKDANVYPVRSSHREFNRVKVILCPSFTDLEEVGKILKKSNKAEMGAQDMFWKDEGAFTGEVSAKMLKELGAKYVIMGHSERRRLGETDKSVRKKIDTAIKASLTPIICVGETLEERKNGLRDEVLMRQIRAVSKNLKLGTKDIVIAYEPVWAIGTGRAAKPKDASEAEEVIKKILSEYIPEKKIEKQITIIYGGSITSKNISGFIEKGKMSGGLVGGASLNAEEFLKIIEKIHLSFPRPKG